MKNVNCIAVAAWLLCVAIAADFIVVNPVNAQVSSAAGPSAVKADETPTPLPIETYVAEIANGARVTTMIKSGTWMRVVEHRNGIETQTKNDAGEVNRLFFKTLDEAAAVNPESIAAFQWVQSEGLNRFGPSGFGSLTRNSGSGSSRFGPSNFGDWGPDSRGFGSSGFGPRRFGPQGFGASNFGGNGFGPQAFGPGQVPDIRSPDVMDIPNPIRGGRDMTLEPIDAQSILGGMQDSMMKGIGEMDAKRKKSEDDMDARSEAMKRQMDSLKNRVRRSF
ncbi:hypothetical protein Poly51_38050 [Rubripirellula tenax]|uniref:Secreted protein n=1 Tax=Rubripirellula tenax TaxID=2528015 RepID=A0A5C6EPJ7_9BACT|nr:hypothetical protein [Rubripirellula tenax]TWU50515.1 hypothetical protein Poly51_38050 [Rubripirellula tenax]